MDVLSDIVASRRRLVEQAKADRPADELRAGLPIRQTLSLSSALKAPGVSLIAEIKGASPSKGDIRKDLDAGGIGRLYEDSGASAVSVLTEPAYFAGSVDNIEAVRAAVDIPVMCKDFVVDEYQVVEARYHGADAILLIAEALTDGEIDFLVEIAHELGMETLLEVMDRENLLRALDSSSDAVGVNNRDLRTLEVDMARTASVVSGLDIDRPLVSESGISGRADVVRLEKAGIDGILVGTALMEAKSPERLIAQLLG